MRSRRFCYYIHGTQGRIKIFRGPKQLKYFQGPFIQADHFNAVYDFSGISDNLTKKGY